MFLKGFDLGVFACVLLLLLISNLIIYSTSSNSPEIFLRQIVYSVIGIIIFFLVSHTQMQFLKQISVPFYLLTIFFLIFTFIWGLETRGSTRWIDLKLFIFQPSELFKPALILFLGSYFSDRKTIKLKEFLLSIVFISLPLFLIFKQPDLGNTIVILAIWFFACLVARISWRIVSFLPLFILLLLPLLWNLIKDYQRQRIIAFLNPNLDPFGSAYNTIQAIIAVGSGQFFGRGLGRGSQSQLNFLPEARTDFIFATVAEELGFIGALLLLSLFLFLIWRILKIGSNSADSFKTLVATGVASLIMTQVFISIGMNMGLLPVAGITLPFLSFGGSSLITTLICLGFVVSIKKEEERSRDTFLRD